MNDEKLILLVKARDCIYNKSNAGDNLSDRNKNVWKQIAQEMQVPEESCIKRWACIRDKYVMEKHQENVSSGSDSTIKSTWHLMQSMEFMDPHIILRPMRSSYNLLDEYSSSPLSIDIPTLSPEYESPSPVSSIMPSQNLLALPTTPSMRNRKRHITEMNDLDKAFCEAVGAFKELCESEVERIKQENRDPLLGFGEMIVATIRSMSARNQFKAMQRVTTLVMEMKLKEDD